MKLDMKGST